MYALVLGAAPEGDQSFSLSQHHLKIIRAQKAHGRKDSCVSCRYALFGPSTQKLVDARLQHCCDVQQRSEIGFGSAQNIVAIGALGQPRAPCNLCVREAQCFRTLSEIRG